MGSAFRPVCRALSVALIVAQATALSSPTLAQADLRSCVSEVKRTLDLAWEKAKHKVSPEGIREEIAAAKRHGVTPLKLAVDAGSFVFYPSIAKFRFYFAAGKALKSHGIAGIRRVPFEFVKQDGGLIVGYAAFVYVAGALPTTYLELHLLPSNSRQDFEDDNPLPERSDGIMVYVNAVPRGNILSSYGAADAEARFNGRKDAHYIRAKGIDDMMEQLELAASETGRSIASVEVMGHGMPGMIQIGNETLNQQAVKRLKAYHVPFARNATLQFQSCLLGANLVGSQRLGENFMNEIGRTLLKDGGTVVASNHVIVVATRKIDPMSWISVPFQDVLDMIDSENLDFAIQAGLEAIKTHDGPYRRVVIPPSK